MEFASKFVSILQVALEILLLLFLVFQQSLRSYILLTIYCSIQLATSVLEVMVEPVSRSLASAPAEEEENHPRNDGRYRTALALRWRG